MKRIGIRNKTEGRIVLNKMGGLSLVPYSENKYVFLEIGEKGLEDSELISLHQAGLIEVVDADKIPKPAPIQPTTPVTPLQSTDPDAVKTPQELLKLAWGLIANAGGGDWEKESSAWQVAAAKWRDAYQASPEASQPSINDASNSEVTIMTPDGPKTGKMRFSIAGESPQAVALPAPPPPEMLDLNNY